MQTLDKKRRMFFKLLGGVIGGGAAAAIGYSVFTQEGAIDQWVMIGPVADLPADMPQRTSVAVTEHRQFSDRSVNKVVWLRRTAEGGLQVLSGACPHMNCTVAWKAEKKGFDCACHVSNFDAAGKVVSGPSPRPLDALEYRVENGILSVRYQKFRQRVPTREVLT